MKVKKQRILIALTAIVLSFQCMTLNSAALSGNTTYKEYLDGYENIQQPEDEITVTADHLDIEKSRDAEIVSNYSGCEKAVKTGESSTAQFQFDVKKAGFYRIEVCYIPVTGKDIPIERKIEINGAVPFSDFNDILFDRTWKDADITANAEGNEYIPEQYEVFSFKTVPLYSGKATNDGYQVYLQTGWNTITFVSLKEGMVIEFIKFCQKSELPSYDQYLNDLNAQNISNEAKEPVRIQAEKAYEKSDISLYPLNDRTSPATYPNDLTKIKLNTIGGENWRNLKQKISWEVSVKKSGYYKIALRYKQDYTEGSVSFRRLYIDGNVSFKEASQIGFSYQRGWQAEAIGGDTPYLFYLIAGKHTITLENVYGNTSEVFESVRNSITDLNTLYRKIIMITSLNPDSNRDYSLESQITDLLSCLEDNAEILNKAKNDLVKLTGTKGQSYSLIEMLEYQLNDFHDKPRTIPSRISNFSTNISTLSSWVLSESDQPLLLDYIELLPESNAVSEADVSAFKKFTYGMETFVASFFNDYNNIVSTSDTEKSVTLWLGGTTVGRDQANAMKILIDNSFTREYGISVNMRLVDSNALLPAVASGSGPDVAIAQERTMPLNYGFRGAVYDLSNFSDCNTVLNTFPEAATVPFIYKNNVYGLPDTFVFQMMFYRKDILQELNLDIPQTWKDVYTILPKLNNKYLNFGLPSVTTINNDIYYTLLFQNGGSLYTENLDEATLNTEEAIASFQAWSDLYTKYSVQQAIDQFTRFRTGEAPIVIAPYTFYNQLVATAPEIDGLWDMTLVPGIENEDGTISRDVSSTGTAAVIFQNSKDKESAWEFLKWWTSADAQQQYDRQLEIIQGPSARVAIACTDALDMLPWSVEDIKKLKNEMQYAQGVPEVPGGYMTQRYINTALLLTVNNSVAPRTAITNYNKLINNEIQDKMAEFGLK